MGKKGREIVGVNVEELLEDLNRAYADEWIAYYYYTWAADFVEGPCYPLISDRLDKTAAEEHEHMSELSDRIYELGGEVFPENERDLESVVKAAVEAERCAIDVYNKMVKKLAHCYDTDIRTFHLIEHILSEEIEHEEAFENLLEKK